MSAPRTARSGVYRRNCSQSASIATGPAPIERTIIYALLGGLVGALIGVIVALAIGRNDRRLRQRDEIANSIGIPVLASVPVAHPSAAGGWTKLLENYKPAAVHSWQLRTALQQLGMARPGFGRPAYNGNGSSLYDDHRAAMYDGDGGAPRSRCCPSPLIPTLSPWGRNWPSSPPHREFRRRLSSARSRTQPPRPRCAPRALRRCPRHRYATACCESPPTTRVASTSQPDTALVIVVAVVDSRAPKMPDTMRTNATVIGVSAGAVTAEQLARAAVVAAGDGREITGILVADPDPDDQTTGRIPHLARPARRRLPNRLRGIVTEIRR